MASSQSHQYTSPYYQQPSSATIPSSEEDHQQGVYNQEDMVMLNKRIAQEDIDYENMVYDNMAHKNMAHHNMAHQNMAYPNMAHQHMAHQHMADEEVLPHGVRRSIEEPFETPTTTQSIEEPFDTSTTTQSIEEPFDTPTTTQSIEDEPTIASIVDDFEARQHETLMNLIDDFKTVYRSIRRLERRSRKKARQTDDAFLSGCEDIKLHIDTMKAKFDCSMLGIRLRRFDDESKNMAAHVRMLRARMDRSKAEEKVVRRPRRVIRIRAARSRQAVEEGVRAGGIRIGGPVHMRG